MNKSLIPSDGRTHVVLCHMDDEGEPGDLLLGQLPVSSHETEEAAIDWLYGAMTDPTYDSAGGFETTLDLMRNGEFILYEW